MMRRIRASKISLIFQEPGLSLNPVMTIGDQILETIYLHTSLRGQSAKNKSVRLAEQSRNFGAGKKNRYVPA